MVKRGRGTWETLKIGKGVQGKNDKRRKGGNGKKGKGNKERGNGSQGKGKRVKGEKGNMGRKMG